MSVVALTVPLELSDAGAIIPIPGGGGTGNGTIFVVDTAGFNSISIQFTGTWLANVQFQTSNDRVNWVNTQGFAFNSQITSTDTVVDNDVYLVPVIGRYFQVVVSNYQSGPIGITAYLRYQSIAGLGEASLTQAMDQTTGTPLNVGFQGFTGPGQQNAANSFPVALANEQVVDKYIAGKAYTQTTTYLNFNMLLSPEQAAIDPGAAIDCLQYRAIYFQFNSAGNALGGNTVNATFISEMSNDQVFWTNTPLFRLDGASAVGANQVRNFNPVNYGSNASFGAHLTMRYFRLRCSSFSSSSFIQFSSVLRMAPDTLQIETYTNIAQQAGSGLATSTTNFASTNQTQTTTGGQVNGSIPALIVGGNDRSLVKPEMIGAPIGAYTPYFLGGPWARAMYVDNTGGVGVAGPPPNQVEDKTIPVNVRLERTTSGQDSVQDILQQILVELKALSYYTRETPLAIANALSTGTPGNPASMLDDPENFFDDPTLYQLKKGH